MGKELNLYAQSRASEKNKELKEGGYIPAVVYGNGLETKSLLVKSKELNHVFAEAGEATLINLSIDKKQKIKVIIKDIQKSPLKRNITHVDFHVVSMDKAIDVEIPLLFVGESKAVREQGATLIKARESVNAHCLPGDLVDHIEVNLGLLETIDSIIHVSDVKAPKGVTIVEHEHDAIAAVELPRDSRQEEAEEKPAETKTPAAANNNNENK